MTVRKGTDVDSELSAFTRIVKIITISQKFNGILKFEKVFQFFSPLQELFCKYFEN
jgi:hypothetical protein